MGGKATIKIKMKSSKQSKSKSRDHLSKNEKKEVKKIVAGKPEVKYFSSALNNYNIRVFPGVSTPVGAGLSGPFSTAQSGFTSLLAQNAQGTGPNERIGNRITPVKARCTWQFQLLEAGTAGGAGTSGPQNLLVHLYVVEPKGYNNLSTVANIPAGKFLLRGDGTCQDPNVLNNVDQIQMLQVINHLPVNRNLYKVKMHKKFLISKNAGIQNANPYTTSTIGEFSTQNTSAGDSTQTITYDWVPPKFKYNTPTDIFPNNHNPLFIVWATTVDGTKFPTCNAGSGPDQGMLTYGYRAEYWFTDE